MKPHDKICQKKSEREKYFSLGHCLYNLHLRTSHILIAVRCVLYLYYFMYDIGTNRYIVVVGLMKSCLKCPVFSDSDSQRML